MVNDETQQQLVANQNYTLDYLSRMALAKKFNSRDFYEIFGYDENLTYVDYYHAFKRGDVATRIINAYPSATWSNPPTVTDDDTSGEDSAFDKSWKKLIRKHKVFPTLKRFDKLTRLGKFAILVIGVKGTGKLNTPLPARGGSLAYLHPYAEKDIEITKYEENENNPRFGLPTEYEVTTYLKKANGDNTEKKFKVHWTRCLHNAEEVLDTPGEGTPALEPIMNRLLDLQKVVGGGSEMFWLNGRGGMVANADKDTHMENPEKLKEEMQAFADQLTRWIATKGIKTEILSIPVPDPEPQFRTIMSLISGATGIPQRILLGAEAGELASTQDKLNWQDRVDERRNDYSEPEILIPFIEKMIEIGELSRVEYSIVWPPLGDTDEKTQAEIATKKATAISAYVNSPGSSMLIPPEQFVEDILGEEYRTTDLDKLGDDFEEKIMRSSEAAKQAGQPAAVKEGEGDSKKSVRGIVGNLFRNGKSK